MKILLIDNHDSFTYNLVDYLEQGGAVVTVYRNDDSELSDAHRSDYDGIVLSPGPGRPEQAGQLMSFIEKHVTHVPILGICLGHQALGLSLGATLSYAPEPRHGKTSTIDFTTDHPIWKSIQSPSTVMRYHSLILTKYDRLHITPLAIAQDDQTLMAFESSSHSCIGLQFHPESIGSKDGITMIKNWLEWI